MKFKIKMHHLLATSAMYASFAFSVDAPTMTIHSHWAHCQYNVQNKDKQIACFKQVMNDNQKALESDPESLELITWLGIIKSALAEVEGGTSALSLVKEAKVLFEQVIAKDPMTLDGSVYTSLGALYYKVPGWPIGFGDNDKAEIFLKKGVEIDPTGIDTNYFYADFLAQEGRNEEAKHYLLQAQKAKPRVGRPLADKGRQRDIKILLASVE